MRKLTKYFRGVGEEARRIRWPNSKVLWKSVGIVMVISIVAALSIVLSDWLAAQIMKAFEEAFPKNTESATDTANAAFRLIGWFKNGGLF